MVGPRVLERAAECRVSGKELTAEQWETKRRVRQAAARLYAEYGAAYVGRRRVAVAAGMDRDVVARLYPEEADLLLDVLAEHVHALNGAVCAAFDASAVGAFERLEAVVRAWLEQVAAEPAEHRCLVFCARLLPEAMRRGVLLKYGFVLETVLEALGGVVPGLGGVGSLMGTARALLSDVGWWPEALAVEDRARTARRIAGLLVAAAEAEAAGSWGAGRPAAGVVDGRVQGMESHEARIRWREVLDAVGAGAEVVLTRRGKNSVRLVRAG